MCVNVSTSCKGALPLSNLLKNRFAEGICPLHEPKSVLLIFCQQWTCIYLVIRICKGVVLAVLHVLLWVWVAGPSGVDVSNMLIKAVVAVGVSFTYTSHEGQSAALWQAPDIHSNVML